MRKWREGTEEGPWGGGLRTWGGGLRNRGGVFGRWGEKMGGVLEKYWEGVFMRLGGGVPLGNMGHPLGVLGKRGGPMAD